MAGPFIKRFSGVPTGSLRGGRFRPSSLTSAKTAGTPGVAAAASKNVKVWQPRGLPRGPSSKNDLQVMVAARLAQLKGMSDVQVLHEFETALKTKISECGFAWGKDPQSHMRSSADYVNDVVRNQGKGLNESVSQLKRLPDTLDMQLEDVAQRGFAPEAVADLRQWLATGPVLVEFQTRVHAHPEVFAKLTGVPFAP